MNIFILDKDIDKCAKAHVKKHIGKMQLESSQLLCTTLHLNKDLRNQLGVTDIPYKQTHKNHPSAVWSRENLDNYSYLAGLLYSLNLEYSRRYGKQHLSFTKMQECGITGKEFYERAKSLDVELLNPPACMPDEYKRPTVIESYREYYRVGKKNLHDWENSVVPDWILNNFS